jgi:hypothetical protein
MSWTHAPYVFCEHCERETLLDESVTMAPGVEVACEHCKATVRIVEVEAVLRTRTQVIRLAPGAAFEDEETPVQTPQQCPNCLAQNVLYAWVGDRARCPQCPPHFP